MTQASNVGILTPKINSSGQLDATTGLTGAVPVANGGTGAATYTANNVLLGNGTSAFQTVAPSTNGNVLTSNGTTWVSSAPAGGGGLGGITTYGFLGTASKSTTVLTVTAVTSGTINVGDTISTTGGTSLGVVSSFGTGTGGAGTYNMSTSGTQASTSVYTSAGTFTIPTGKTVVRVTVIGGGGSGGNSGTGSNGNAGGTSSISSGTQTITTFSSTGGSGGSGGGGTFSGGVANSGSSSGATVNYSGINTYQTYYNGQYNCGLTLWNYVVSSVYNTQSVLGFGYGSSGGSNGTTSNSAAGGSGGVGVKYFTGLTPGNTLTVTIGNGGTAASGVGNPGAGGIGIIIIEY